jgi:hypothetical protein
MVATARRRWSFLNERTDMNDCVAVMMTLVDVRFFRENICTNGI